MGRSDPLALATCRQLPNSCPDDVHLLGALASAGVPAACVPWDAEQADWGRFRGVLIRATWDYYLRPGAFLGWLERLEDLGVPVWNPVPTLRWNLDKRYLLELAAKGLDVVPTRRVERGRPEGLAALMDREGWDDVVVKPAISAGGHATFRVARAGAAAAQEAFEALAGRDDVLVQPFVPEVAGEGEWSLVFLGGAFSHALVKRPGAGEFRVQEKHGGSLAGAAPPPGLVAQAERVLAAAPGPLLYARVDGVVRGGRLLLMELEALEPELFFRLAPGSAGRLAALLAAR